MFIKLTKTDGLVLGIDTTDIKTVLGRPEGPSSITMKCGCGGYKPNGEIAQDVVHEVEDTPESVITRMNPINVYTGSRPARFTSEGGLGVPNVNQVQ